MKGVVDLDGLPPGDRPEIAFAGRSNVGKSSLINALCNRKNLARASNTPGRTQEINFFDLAEGRFYLVDLPGYGFADAPKKNVDAWSQPQPQLPAQPLEAEARLHADRQPPRHRRGRPRRHEAARQRRGAVPGRADQDRQDQEIRTCLTSIAATTAALMKQPAAHPHVLATSSEKGLGIPELRATILSLA